MLHTPNISHKKYIHIKFQPQYPQIMFTITIIHNNYNSHNIPARNEQFNTYKISQKSQINNNKYNPE